MLEPGRQFSNGTQYRYGFNGKEQDIDIDGTGVDYDYGMRIYDARVGKFLSVDTLQKKYPYYTPYQFASNSPVLSVDIDGMESSTSLNKAELQFYDFFDQFKAKKASYENSSWIGPVWNWKPAIFVYNVGTVAYNQAVSSIQSAPSVPIC